MARVTGIVGTLHAPLPREAYLKNILNFIQGVYIATQSQGNLHISESIFFIGFLQDSEIIVKVMG